MKNLEFTEIANQINKFSATKHLRAKLWEKGEMSRIYINVGYNTKKMSTKAYLYLTETGVKFSVKVNCESQPFEWEASQEEMIINSSEITRLLKLANYFVQVAKKDFATQVNNIELDMQPVEGYYTEWRNVRVSINSFGKLANRNRQYMVYFHGTKNAAPKNLTIDEKSNPFITAAFEKLKALGEIELEPYQEADARIGSIAVGIARAFEFEMQAPEREAARLKKAEDDKIEAEAKKQENELILATISESENPLAHWKASGFIQPAPQVVYELKAKSGLSWNDFKASI